MSIDLKITTLAMEKFRELSERFDGFISVILDDWRGYRLIYDVQNNCCKDFCKNCSLYTLLENEKEGVFSAGLLTATQEDKRLFGPQNFLNCKSLLQYKNCYINFLTQNCNTKLEVFNELDLVKNMKILYLKNGNSKEEEARFKQDILRQVSTFSLEKKKYIQEYLLINSDFLSE